VLARAVVESKNIAASTRPPVYRKFYHVITCENPQYVGGKWASSDSDFHTKSNDNSADIEFTPEDQFARRVH